MANEIKIGISSIDSFKVGTYDCQIYLGTVKLYPNITPVTTPYLTFVVRNSQARFKLSGNTTSYSLDSGETWTSLSANTWSPVVASGSTIMWKATNPTITTDRGIGRFYSSGGTFDVEGNIMSLLYGDNYEGQTALQGDNQFRELFDSNTSVRNASGLTLPATAMTANCYRSMFGNCTNLVSGPTELPATTLADGCYRYMFAMTKVANAPSILPATTMAASACTQMFNGCTLTTAPQLPATTLEEYCYDRMFQGCSSLTTAPALPATALTNSCYYQMFRGCTSLTKAPKILPATNLGDRCYENMFRDCTSLTTAPELPATTLRAECYNGMFRDCTSLTTAPVLSATTLTTLCYNNMFRDCTSLTYVKCLATTHLVSGNTNNMFNGITTTGTFERASGTNWPCEAMIPSTWSITPPYDPVYAWNTSTDATDYCCDSTTYTKYYKDYYQVSYQNGCNYQNVTPEQWRQSTSVIEYYSKDCGYVAGYFTIRSLADNNTITLKNNTTGTTVGTTTFYYSTDSGSTWNTFSLTTGSTQTIATLSSGDTIMMYGTKVRLGMSYNRGHYFRGTANYEIEGNIASLVNGDNETTDLSSKSAHTFSQLFSGDTHLVSAEKLKIYSETLPESCFNGTFRDCSSLVKAPELPSTILGKESYSSMFEGCIALSQPPSQLVFTSASTDSYNRMFCMSRSSKITTPAMTSSPKMFGDWGSLSPVCQQMFCGNGNLRNVYCYWTKSNHSFGTNMTNWLNYTNAGTFTKRSTESFGNGASGIPSNWTKVNDDTTQPS